MYVEKKCKINWHHRISDAINDVTYKPMSL